MIRQTSHFANSIETEPDSNFSTLNTNTHSVVFNDEHVEPSIILAVDQNLSFVGESNINLLIPNSINISLSKESIFHEFINGLIPEQKSSLIENIQLVIRTKTPQQLTIVSKYMNATERFSIKVLPVTLDNHEASNFLQDDPANTQTKQHCLLLLERIKELQSTAKSHNDLAKNYLEFTSNAMVIIDATKNIIFANQAFKKTLGIDRLTSGSLEDIFLSNNLDKKTSDHIWHTLFYEKHWSGEVNLTSGSKKNCSFWISAEAKENENGSTYYYFLCHEIASIGNIKEKLEHSLTHDHTTGLLNRSSFIKSLDEHIKIANDNNKIGAIFYIDIDYFKLINEVHGEILGDVALLNVATRLKKSFREASLTSRLSGDSFAIAFSDIGDFSNAHLIGKNILEKIKTPFLIENIELQLKCSIGLASFSSETISSTELIKRAETAMHAAKALGRNNLQSFDHRLSHDRSKQLNMQNHLNNAIKNKEFTMHYQPQFDMKTNKLIGVESLMRWSNEELGSVSPAVFIPILESSGLIYETGLWIIETVCRQMKVWREFCQMDCPVGVNVSRSQLTEPKFANYVIETLNKFEIPPHLLEIEITEEACTSSEKVILDTLQKLQSHGCKIAIDDFGTGYSSLSNLQNFPLDRLKIDKTFIEKVDYDQNSYNIASTIVNLGKTLKLDIIAEGIETKEQMKHLLKMGCRNAQGYYYSRPVSNVEFNENFLKPRKK